MGFSLIILAAVPFALFGLHMRSNMSLWQRRAWIGGLIVAVALAVSQLGAIALHNVRTVPEWDFLGFWLNAHVAAAHQNVYDPSFARALSGPFTTSDDFRREIVDVGFWYPPPSIFVFLPLGAFANLHLAYGIWYLIQAVALVAAIVVLAQTFLRDDGAEGVLAVAVLVLALPATAATVLYGQTNFLLLLGIALFWRAKDRLAGGAWLGAAVLVKPFVSVVGLALLLRRRFAPVAGAIAALVVASAGAAALLGAATFKAYLSAGPNQKLPPWVYSESTNQSLLGVILRAAHVTPAGTMHLPPAYLLAALVLVLATAWLCMRAERDADDLVLSLCLALGLLVYPVSQAFYAVVLVLPVLVLWRQRQTLPWRTTGVVAFVVLLYVVTRVRHETLTVIAYMLVWLALAMLTARASADARVVRSLERIGNERALAAVFVVAAAVLIGHDIARPNAPLLAKVGSDFRAFYCSGYVVDRGADPYRVEPLRACEHRVQPAAGWSEALVVPSPLPGYGLALFGALARLPYAAAKDLWYLGIFASLLVTIAILRRLSDLPIGMVFLALALVGWWVPFLFGQLPPLAVAALCCATAFVTLGRSTAAAVAASVAMIEPHLGLPACLAMFAWLPRTRLPLALCAVALAGIGAATVGPYLSVAYLTRILPDHAAAELVAVDQFSISHLAHVAGFGDATALALGTLSYLAMTALGVFLAQRVASAMQTSAFIVLLPPAIVLLGGPFVHDIQFAAAIPAAVLLAAKANRWRPAAWVALALISLPWFSLGRGGYVVLGEQLVALAAVVAFAVSAARDTPHGAYRLATTAGILAMFPALIVLAHLPRAHLDRPTIPMPATALAPEALASANWAAYLRADPALGTPSLQAESKKVPFWMALLLLIAVAFRQTRMSTREAPVTESRRFSGERVAQLGPIEAPPR
jgi:Glycosyltransferase family 87